MTQSVKGTRTELNLKEAFAGESQANRRYLYFANMADVAGDNDIAALFRSTAEGETGHAHGHMEYLIEGGAGDPGTGMTARTVTPCNNTCAQCVVIFMTKPWTAC
jgi:rubrerythrin